MDLREWQKRWNTRVKGQVVFDPQATELQAGVVPLGIPAVDDAFGGGVPRGRLSIFVGEASSGKTLLSQLIIASAQRAGGTAVFMDIERCVTAGHRVLTADLRWAAVETLRPGDKIIGFDDHPIGGRGFRRMMREGIVTCNEPFEADAWEMTLKDGTTIVCTGNHPWLVYNAANKNRVDRPGGATYWAAPKFFKKHNLPTLKKAFEPWEESDDRDLGWLAGFFDGEGCLSQLKGRKGTVGVGATQNEGPVLERAKSLFDKYGVPYTINNKPDGPRTNTPCRSIRVAGGQANTIRFLGQVRPVRLLKKLDVSRLGTVPTAARVKVVSVRKIGKRTFYGLSTTCQTYFVEGFCAHNTYDARWFALTGVDTEDPEKLVVVRPRNLEQCFDMACDVLTSVRPDVLVLDSIPAMVPKAVLDADMEKSDFRGVTARKVTEGVGKLTQYNQTTAVILINQLRVAMGVKFGNPESMPGGKALRFYTSLIVRTRRGAWITDAGGDGLDFKEVKDDDDKEAQRIGFKLRLRTEKNKTAPPWQEADLEFRFNGTIDWVGSLVHLALQRGVISQPSTGYFEAPDLFEGKIHGRSALEILIREDEELRTALVAAVRERK